MTCTRKSVVTKSAVSFEKVILNFWPEIEVAAAISQSNSAVLSLLQQQNFNSRQWIGASLSEVFITPFLLWMQRLDYLFLISLWSWNSCWRGLKLYRSNTHFYKHDRIKTKTKRSDLSHFHVIVTYFFGAKFCVTALFHQREISERCSSLGVPPLNTLSPEGYF